MNLAVLGATGRTGRPLVEELLRRGHTVTALARDPAKLAELGDRIQVVVSTSTDPAALDQLLTDTDAVVSALGPSAKEAILHTDSARALVAAMARHGVTRFVGVSGAGIDVPGDRKGPRDKAISWVVKTIGRHHSSHSPDHQPGTPPRLPPASRSSRPSGSTRRPQPRAPSPPFPAWTPTATRSGSPPPTSTRPHVQGLRRAAHQDTARPQPASSSRPLRSWTSRHSGPPSRYSPSSHRHRPAATDAA